MGNEVPGLAELLARFRERQGISRRALSHQAGLSESYVGKLETGKIEPSLEAFLRIVRALKLTRHEIMFCIQCSLAVLEQ